MGAATIPHLTEVTMSPRLVGRPVGLLCAALLAAVLVVLGCGTHSNAPTAPHQNSLSSSTGSTSQLPPKSMKPLILSPVGDVPDPLQLAIQVQEKYSPVLMSLPGVVGTGATIDDSHHGVVEVLV